MPYYQIKPKRGKYNNKGTEYNGRWYHSKKESRYAEQLDWMLKAGKTSTLLL